MPPNAAATLPDPSSLPLADYFFISGIEASSIFDSRLTANGAPASPTLNPTIEEDAPPLVSLEGRPQSAYETLDSAQRKKRFSYEARKSISSMISPDSKISSSNRSSVTIKAPPEIATPASLTEEDFDEALRKFATERDSFLEGIQFSAGQIAMPNKPRPRPKTQRITSDDGRDKTAVAGIRRRLSTMKPLSRSNTAARRSSGNRNSKRISGYNSVIPAPQRFKFNSNMHPLKRQYEPGLLDQYPGKNMADETKKRAAFPDYVPMFVFPNDVNVVSSDERPRATWHGFAMTSGDNSKLYGICLIVWIPLSQDAAVDLEKQCEEWRKRNMTNEERELANSLGERLAIERAHLSKLLAELPSLLSGSDEREAKEEEIGAVEEKIGLMTDMLRPVRHGAASKIEGLTESDTGLWIPRAYGVLGRDQSLTSFWKEWLKAVVSPMFAGSILRIPPSSPRVGTWQPLERYVVNLCAEALSPNSSITQVELAIRELRLYARKEAINELPGSRNVDLYALFRSLDIPDIIVLFEYVLSESRIILLSSHTSMLHLASAALVQLLYPLKWHGVFIPVLPARLIQALEAPCPYIVGIERRYEGVELPEDDFVLVDLDQGLIEATSPPISLPRQIRRKLASILQLAAPHRYRYGVPVGPPKYAIEAYPNDAFMSENASIFSHSTPSSNLAQLANLNSASFGNGMRSAKLCQPIFNAFLSQRNTSSHSSDRPSTPSTTLNQSPPSPVDSYNTGSGSAIPAPVSRDTSGHMLQASLREKRSGVFDSTLRRNSSFGMPGLRRPSMPYSGHASTTSVSTLATADGYSASSYAPSVYAQSTLAASTVMPNVLMQPVRNTANTQWAEGHCMNWQPRAQKLNCSICTEKTGDRMYTCSGCGISAHDRCIPQICIVCSTAFHQDQVLAAFVRCFASLFYTYRKSLSLATSEQKRNGAVYQFNMDHFLKSVPHDSADYVAMLRDTQGFNQFIQEREFKKADDPSIRLFDEIIMSKRNRGRSSMFSKSNTNFLFDRSDHLWHSAAATAANSRAPPADTRAAGRIPAKLDPSYLKEPRVMQGIPRAVQAKARLRKPVPSMLSINTESVG